VQSVPAGQLLVGGEPVITGRQYGHVVGGRAPTSINRTGGVPHAFTVVGAVLRGRDIAGPARP
jgi:hypothetical protein